MRMGSAEVFKPSPSDDLENKARFNSCCGALHQAQSDFQERKNIHHLKSCKLNAPKVGESKKRKHLAKFPLAHFSN